MANCATYEAEYQQLIGVFNGINGQWQTAVSQGLSAANAFNEAGARAAISTLNSLESQAQILENRIESLLSRAEFANCPAVVNGAELLLSRTENLIANIDDAKLDIEDKLEQVQEDLQDSEDATTSEEFAGDGEPGSAEDDALFADEDLIVDDEPLPEDEFEDDFGEGLKEPPDVTDDELGIDPDLEREELEKAAALNAAEAEFLSSNTNFRGLSGAVDNARQQATLQDTTNFEQKEDWRVRLSLAPGAFYLYKDESNELLAPLRKTDGIIFPYTPSINVTYGANYQSVAPVHSNYKIFQYENSFVDSVTITCDFTAQDTEEAKYMLAVIHFLRSVTKMFYGQDFNPKPGTPPPLCYLFGLGEFQFNAHPLAITNFTYNLPTDVDYIRAGALTEAAGVSRSGASDSAKPATTSLGTIVQNAVQDRLNQGVAAIGNALGLNLQPGGVSKGYTFGTSNRFNSPVPPGTIEPTYVPTKINISISAIPIVSRYEISSEFSVYDYANGTLLRGTKRPGGGIW
jgi:hypothetical protein